MLPNEWIINDKFPVDIITSILKGRGIENREGFLNPPHPRTIQLNEFGLSKVQLNKAKKLISEAKAQNQTVVIYGDYDVDGTCATSLLWKCLNEYGLKVFPFIPDRFRDGYGMTISGLDQICTLYKDVQLLITVDNGIVAHEAIEEAHRRGLQVIVTDHHEASNKNKADALIHSTKMCGTALAWCLAKYLVPDMKEDNLDLVGIATIADQMKLTGINRSFALHGISALKKSRNIGLQALCQSSEIVLSEVGTYEIGYIIGPRINAAGRLSNALDVVRLLCTKNKSRAREIAQNLSNLNMQRQEITTTVLTKARLGNNKYEKINLVVGSFHEGVIGLAAGKLVEETGLPSIVFSQSDTHTKGSARSIPGFSITEALRVFGDLFVNVGGHEMAAGFTIENQNLDVFISKFSEYVAKNLPQSLFLKKLKIDCQITFDPISTELLGSLKQLEPYGIGNPKPSFLTTGIIVSAVRFLGKNREHVKLTLDSDGKQFDGLLFHIKSEESVPKVGSQLDVVYSIDENKWNGKISLQLILKDFHEIKRKSSRKSISKTRKRSSSRK